MLRIFLFNCFDFFLYKLGHSIYICNNSHITNQSYSNLGLSFKHPDYAYGSNEARSFLAGSYNFLTKEIEVYTKD